MKVLLFVLLLLTHMPALAKSRVEITQENAPSVVAVNILQNDGTTFTGTGFIVTPDGVIATSRHVVQNALYINVTFHSGITSGAATVLGQSDEVDLAIIKIAAKDLPTVTLGDASQVLPGQDITVIGNPRRLQNTVSSGLISQIRKTSTGAIWHQISAPISPSSSGSPVFNRDGKVVSVAFSSYGGEGNQNLNFAVPVSYLTELLHSHGYYPAGSEEQTPDSGPSWWDKCKNHFMRSWQIAKQLLHLT